MVFLFFEVLPQTGFSYKFHNKKHLKFGIKGLVQFDDILTVKWTKNGDFSFDIGFFLRIEQLVLFIYLYRYKGVLGKISG
jgi:hypothetical protein